MARPECSIFVNRAGRYSAQIGRLSWRPYRWDGVRRSENIRRAVKSRQCREIRAQSGGETRYDLGMSLGRFGTLLGFSLSIIGSGLIVYYPGTGVVFILIGVVVLIGMLAYAVYSSWGIVRARARKLGTPQVVLLIGLAGAWSFMTMGIGAAAWMIWTQQGFAIGASGIGVGVKEDEGPLVWFRNMIMEGGPNLGRNVFSLTFRGVNTSQKEVELKSASIISAVNGAKIDLEVIAQTEIVSIDKIELIPPGAPIQLIAKFGPHDPSAPGKILGLEPKLFLETWRQFSLNVQDDSKPYRIRFNEGDLAPFFPGMVGPHVSKKASSGQQPD
jgi:hypothetical protein